MRIQHSPKTLSNQEETKTYTQTTRTSELRSGVAAVKDGMEIHSAVKRNGYQTLVDASLRQEKSGAIELSTDQQRRAGSTDLQSKEKGSGSGNDILEALRARAHSRYETEQPDRTSKENLERLEKARLAASSQYSVPSNGGPRSVQEARADREGRKEELHSRANSKREELEQKLSNPFQSHFERKEEARGKMNVKDEPAGEGASTTGDGSSDKKSLSDRVANAARSVGQWALDVLGGAKINGGNGMSPPGGNEAMTLLNAPQTVEDVTGDSKDLLRGAQVFSALKDGTFFEQRMHQASKDCEWDKDGLGGGSSVGPGRDDDFLPEELRIENVLKWGTGRGSAGGETVNPNPEATGGGRGSFRIGNPFDLNPQSTQGKQQMVGNPLRDRETSGSSGTGSPGGGQANGGSIDFEDGSGWQGSTKTEEPGDVQTGPQGNLAHLLDKD